MSDRWSSATRRRLLEASVGAAAVTLPGCISADPAETATSTATDNPGSTVNRSTTPSASNDTGRWSQFGADPRNTGHDPTVAGPGPDDPALAWRYDTGTPTMNTSPVVGDGTVYVPGSGDPGTVHAVDIETGDGVWQFEPAGYASSAPALADETLYFGTFDKQFYAIDAATGEEVWRRDVGHRFGSSSPVVLEETVYVGTTGDGPLRVSGPEDEEKFEPCALLALDASTGEERWRYDDFEKKDRIESSPAIADGRVHFGAERTVYALDAATGDVLWTRDLPVHTESSPAVVDGVVYYGGHGSRESETPSRVWALDVTSGETLWTAGIDDGGLRTSPAVADGTVYVPASSRRTCTMDECSGVTRGRLYALDAASGDRQWTAEIRTDTRSSPAVVDGVVYVGCRDGLSAVTTDGENAWRVPFEGDRGDAPYVKSSPAVANGHVFIGASDGRLRAIGPAGSE